MRCDQCEALCVNGVPCHETGCPRSHIDLRTGEPYEVECRECGTAFVPADGEQCCSPCCSAAYSGYGCECADCRVNAD